MRFPPSWFFPAVLLGQHLLPLFRGQLLLEHGDLILAGMRDVEPGRLAVKPVRSNRVARRAEAVKLAPRQHFDRARIVTFGRVGQCLDILRANGLVAHVRNCGSDVGSDRLGRRRGWRLGWAIRQVLLALRIRRFEAAIGAVEVVELRVRGGSRHQQKERDRTGETHGRDDSKFGRRHGATAATILAGLLMLAACDDIKAPEPGYLGARLDRGPAPAPVTFTGGYHGVLLSGGVEPMIPPGRADSAVGAKLARSMHPDERLALAEASQQAAIAEITAKLDWQTVSPSGQIASSGWVMPVSDPYLGRHGRICRDLRQALARPSGPMVEPVSLCREGVGGGLTIWTLEHFP